MTTPFCDVETYIFDIFIDFTQLYYHFYFYRYHYIRVVYYGTQGLHEKVLVVARRETLLLRSFSVIRIHVSQGSWVRYPVWQHTFVSPSAFSRRAVVSYWRKYVHEVLVNSLGGLSLPRKSVVRLTDRPDMTLDVYRGRKTTIQKKKYTDT